MYKFVILSLFCLVVLVSIVLYSTTRKSGREALEERAPGGSSRELPLPDLRQRRFDLAVMKLANNPKDQDALVEIRRLTMSEPAFLPAHRYAIKHLIQQDRVASDDSMLKGLQKHLEVIANSGDESAKVMLAQVYVASGDHSRAVSLMRSLIHEHPELNPILSRLLILRGDVSLATVLTEKIVEQRRKALASTPNDPTLRLALADNLGILERFAEASDVLHEGADQQIELREPMIRYAIREVDRIINDDPETAFGRLRQCASFDLEHIGVWIRIVSLMKSNNREVAEQAERFANDVMVKKTSRGSLELVLGDDAHRNGDANQAVEYLKTAYRLNPENRAIMNNLAMYSAVADPPDLLGAIAIADQLVDKYPDQNEFRETRGQILALLARDDEAIRDLEKALEAMPNYQPLIDTLSSLYQKTGNSTKAAALRESKKPLTAQRDVDISSLLNDILSEMSDEADGKN